MGEGAGFSRLMVLFVQNWWLEVADMNTWSLPADSWSCLLKIDDWKSQTWTRDRCHFMSASLGLWLHEQGRHVCHKCLLRHEPIFLCSSLVKSETTWPHPEEFRAEAEIVFKLHKYWQNRSKTRKRLKEHFLIGRNRTKGANFRGSPLFQASYNSTTENSSTNLSCVSLMLGSWREEKGTRLFLPPAF